MLKRLAALTVLAVGSVTVAYADPITGTISITGSDNFTLPSGSTPGTITFYAQPPSHIDGTSCAVGCANSGVFSSLTAGTVVTMFPTLPPNSPLPYSLGNNVVPTNIYPSGNVQLISVAGFGFNMTDYSASYVQNTPGCMAPTSSGTATCLLITGDGFFTSTNPNLTQTPGSFVFSTQEVCPTTNSNCHVDTTFSAQGFNTSSPVPEPASLALVGSGLLGAVGVIRRRLVKA
jgi:hypothetical protein